MGIVISSENRSGGQGKTTVIISLATAMSQAYPDKFFLIINTDPQNDCALQLGIDGKVEDKCISQFVLGERPLKEVAIPANSIEGKQRPNLFYVPAGANFANTVETMQEDYGVMKDMYDRLSPAAKRRGSQPEPLTPSEQFLDVLEPLKGNGPAVIFVDCPPSLGPLRQMVHWLADYVLVPVIPGLKEVAMTMQHTEDINQDIDLGARSKILHIIPNRFDTRLSLHQEFLDQLNQVYDGLMYPPIPSRTAVGQSSANGLSIMEADPRNPVSMAYKPLVAEVAKLAGLPPMDEEE